MEKLKKILDRIFIEGLSAMAQGLFATLIIGTIIQQIGTLAGGPAGAGPGVPGIIVLRQFGRETAGPHRGQLSDIAVSGGPWRPGVSGGSGFSGHGGQADPAVFHLLDAALAEEPFFLAVQQALQVCAAAGYEHRNVFLSQ